MTALCAGGGTSSAKPGTRDNMVLAGAGLALLGLFPGFEWLEAVATVSEVVAYFLPTLCATDPPAFPTFTNAEYLAAALHTAGADLDSFNSKLQDVVTRLAWLQFCQCDAGAQPSTPTAPTQPSGVNVVPSVQPCFSLDSGILSLPTTGSTSSVPIIGGDTNIANGILSVAVPPGLTSFDVTVERIASGTNHGNISLFGSYFSIDQNVGTSGSVTSVNVLTTGPQIITSRQLVPAAGRFWKIDAASATHPLDDQVRVTILGGCYGNPAGSGNTPCLPTADILDLLARLKAQVDLLQRRLAPIAYVSGSSHTGLSGQGSFTVDGLLGLKVHLTTRPASYGDAVGEPTFRFLDSWLSMMTDDGVIQERRIWADDSVWTPRLATEATTWGYSFGPGIVATITELEPEP